MKISVDLKPYLVGLAIVTGLVIAIKIYKEYSD